MTTKELEQLLKEAATPIDFQELIQAGVLEKRGSWYAILKFDELPPHAKRKIKSIKQTKKKEVLVKFQPISKRTEKLYKSYSTSQTE